MSEQFQACSQELAAALADRLPLWVEESVERVMRAWSGSVPDEVSVQARAAGEQARDAVGGAIHELLAADLDHQRTTPLALLRSAVRYPTAVLRAAGVPPVERDDFATAAFPEDDYDLAPASFTDFAPALSELGIRWGAAKAFEHKRRHPRPPAAGRG